ncbi:MAG: hypothetical protein ONB37_20005 [candidate division KSB1 bacterium]|nr:hypothetical protein [candidate division KSB1 bacterium]MDZ7402447.1 hypothetical protein [candidate division KSB1 bacterium]
MELTTLVQTITAFLAPILPYLMQVGERAAEGAINKFGEDTWDHAKQLWGRLFQKLKASPTALKAVKDVAQKPDAQDAQISFRVQLEKLLGADPVLAQEIEQLVAAGQRAGTITIASGEKSVAIGGSANHSIIITGDKSSIKSHRSCF